MEQANITFGNNDFVYIGKPILCIPGAISIGGGSVDIECDFSNLPPEHHQIVLSVILSRFPTRILDARGALPERKPAVKPSRIAGLRGMFPIA